MATFVLTILFAFAGLALFAASALVAASGFGGARRVVFAAAVFVALAAWGVADMARAHGDAEWIMANPRYVDAEGVHCCGPSDCEPADAALFRESDAGVWARHGVGDVLMGRELVGRGLYPSIDSRWWWCRRGGVIRCLFKPTSGA